MIVPPAASGLMQHVALMSSMLLSPPSTMMLANDPQPVPVMQVIKTYGSLASRECFGRQAPPGSSCQLPLDYLKTELGLGGTKTSLTLTEFADIIQNDLKFQWPLKPYGVDDSKSLSKTALVNKGAETALYMNELEVRGLYNRHDPTGPLPTSLRPQLNKNLQEEPIDSDTIKTVFDALTGGKGDQITGKSLEAVYQGKGSLDYYGFLNVVGKESVTWPRL